VSIIGRMGRLRIGAAQLGPIQSSDSRKQVILRLLALLEQARYENVDLLVYPELALTPFFPRHYASDRAAMDRWFEREMPGPETAILFARARAYQIGICLGYAELTPAGQHFNTAILVDRDGVIVGKYRKIHLPGHVDHDPTRSFQHLEKRYFEPGDLGFPVFRAMGGVMGMMICNDRRWPESWRVLGLQGVELVMLGYNTPSTNPQRPAEAADKRLFHHRLSVQAGAYQNSTWAVAVAKCGIEDGHHLIGGSLVVNPDGEIVAESRTEADELLVHEIDLEATRFGKSTMFDFARHRRVEHYGLITAATSSGPPKE
jgi:predicted amidohydrolase